MAAAPLRIDHVAYPMYDVAATRRFYAEVLGLTLNDADSGDDWGGKPWLMVIFGDADGRQIALCTQRGRKRRREAIPQDMRHYALAAATPRQFAAWKKRLAAAKVTLREEDHGTQRSIYFDDPNGNTLEITCPPTPRVARRNARAAAVIERWLKAK